MSPFKRKTCAHLDAIKTVKQAAAYECSECMEIGGSWLHLRTCQDCGITLCCDSSPNQHASKHAASHQHQVIASAEPNERWLWCYEDQLFSKY